MENFTTGAFLLLSSERGKPCSCDCLPSLCFVSGFHVHVKNCGFTDKKNPQKGKVKVATKYEFMLSVYSRGNERAGILQLGSAGAWLSSGCLHNVPHSQNGTGWRDTHRDSQCQALCVCRRMLRPPS